METEQKDQQQPDVGGIGQGWGRTGLKGGAKVTAVEGEGGKGNGRESRAIVFEWGTKVHKWTAIRRSHAFLRVATQWNLRSSQVSQVPQSNKIVPQGCHACRQRVVPVKKWVFKKADSQEMAQSISWPAKWYCFLTSVLLDCHDWQCGGRSLWASKWQGFWLFEKRSEVKLMGNSTWQLWHVMLDYVTQWQSRIQLIN